MKSFFVIASLLISISIACSSYKSASSPTPANSSEAPGNASSQTPGSIAQEKTPCTLTLAGAPVIKGLRLGMTPDEVLALFGGSKDDADLRNEMSPANSRWGAQTFVIHPAKYETKGDYNDVTQITVSLLDGRVSSFFIGYSGPPLNHVDEFVAKVVADTALPPAQHWEPYVGLDTQMKTLTCAEFSIEVFSGGTGAPSHVKVQDTEADKKLKDRRKKAREQAKPTPGNQ